MMPPLATIGYEGAAQADVIGRLQSAKVELVIDVRAVAASRRPGFSKTVLGSSLAEAGIGYLHLRPLGTPAKGREAARAGRIPEMHAIFAEHMETPPAQLALLQAADEVRAKRACLLCYEHDWRGCHRAILAEDLTRLTGCEVVHL
jgi:uncharacterized protein (DUF488 family)